jgi:hypothetical protein
MSAEPTKSRLGLGQLASAGDPIALPVDAAVARHVNFDNVVDVEIDERGTLMDASQRPPRDARDPHRARHGGRQGHADRRAATCPLLFTDVPSEEVGEFAGMLDHVIARLRDPRCERLRPSALKRWPSRRSA